MPRSGSLENEGILKELADNRSLVGFSHPTTGNTEDVPFKLRPGSHALHGASAVDQFIEWPRPLRRFESEVARDIVLRLAV